MLNEDALVNWDQVKKMLDFQDSQKEKIEFLINAVSQLANQYTYRKLRARDVTLQLDGRGASSIMLPDYPVNSVTSVFVDSARIFSPSTEKEVAFLNKESGICYINESIPSVPGCVLIQANVGYETIPEDLQLAVLEMIKHAATRMGSGNIGVKSVAAPEGISTSFELTIPAYARRILSTYKRK